MGVDLVRESADGRVGVSTDEARRLALGFPQASEQDHHGRPSFRVAGKIFATLWDARTMNVMLDRPGILTAVEQYPGVCAERWWGKRLAAVSVDLVRAERALLVELLADAWARKAPRRLLQERERAGQRRGERRP